MAKSRIGYRSSKEKDIIRQHFDLPLLEQFSLRENKVKLRYFGLPGVECLDILTWKKFICEVAAVEKNENSLIALESLLDTQFPELRYRTHWGDVDNVILQNRGRKRVVGGEIKRPFVGSVYEHTINRHIWGFDIINLDYFGPLLPGNDQNSTRKRIRLAAFHKLFDIERLDSWKSWLLLLTVEGGKYSRQDLSQLRVYLQSVLEDASTDTHMAIDHYLSGHIDSAIDSAQLIHGFAAILVSSAASNANLRVRPRGSVLYTGYNNRSMVHLAFELMPNHHSNVLGGAVPRFPLLRAPILQTTANNSPPWFKFGIGPCPGATADSFKECLDFLDGDSLDRETGYLLS